MKFLLDHNIPKKLSKTLMTLGHDVIRVDSSARDIDIALKSRSDGRILVSLDRDFANTEIFSPKDFDIIQIIIHPAYSEAIIPAFLSMLKTVPPEEFKGLILLQENGSVRITE